MPSLLELLAADDPGYQASRYMPDVKVEIAFTSGYTTPAAERVWTDVSEWVELAYRIGITHGRQDELSTADANRLTLTLDNSDGRFTAQRAASPYYPNVKLGRPIRVTAMTVTGHTSVRFVGFVDQWPVEWDGTETYAKATVTASSRLARLGVSTKLRSAIEEQIATTGPYRYWTMGDPSGSLQAVEASGQTPWLVDYQPTTADAAAWPIVFGSATGPGFDGLTAVQFNFDPNANYGQYLSIEGDTPSTAGAQTIRLWMLVEALPVVTTTRIITTGTKGLKLSSAGLVMNQSETIVGPNIFDGEGHDIALTHDGTTERLYVDGVEVASGATAAPPAYGGGILGEFDGAIAHLAIYDRALTPTEVAAQAEVVLTGFQGDRTDERLERILAWAGVAAAEIDAETGAETMTYQQTSGQSVVDALRDVESTETGVLFDGRDGLVAFHNRARRYLATAAATFDMAAQHVGADYSPKLDRSTLANIADVENPTTGEAARMLDQASRDEYGEATASARVVADTYDPLQQKAAWLVYSYAEPRPRVPSLTVDVLAHVEETPAAETVLDLDVGDLIAVTNQPAQADATDAEYFVEGYTETIGPESYEISFNLSPSHPSTSTFVLDDADRGELDSSYVLAL